MADALRSFLLFHGIGSWLGVTLGMPGAAARRVSCAQRRSR